MSNPIKPLWHQARLREFYGRKDTTIWRWVKLGVLPKPRKISGQNYWLEEDALRPYVEAENK